MKKYVYLSLILSVVFSSSDITEFSSKRVKTSPNFVTIADPTYDSSFKALFGNEPILKAFLSELIPNVLFAPNGKPYKLESISKVLVEDADEKQDKSTNEKNHGMTRKNSGEITSKSKNEISDSKTEKFKKIVSDIFCTCTLVADKSKPLVIDIEMQRDSVYYFLNRMEYYAARKISEQVPNATYTDINPVLVIAITKNYVSHYKDAGAIFLTHDSLTHPVLCIPDKTKRKKITHLQNIVYIQLENMYEMLTNKEEFEKVKKRFPRTTILFDVLNIERFATGNQSFSLTDGSVAPSRVNMGIYKIDQSELPNSDIKENVIEKLKECAENKKFPKEVSDTENFSGFVDSKFTEGFSEGEKIGIEKGKAEGRAEGEKIGIEKGEKIGAIKARLEQLSKLFSGQTLPSNIDALLPFFGYNNVQEAKSFWDQNKHLLEEQSKPDTEL